jgi:hypothetical protein
MEIVLPGNMTVRESHDIALALQQKIENLDNVERCFVHVDHMKRDGLEHKVERELASNLIAPLPSTPASELRSRFGNTVKKVTESDEHMTAVEFKS